MPPWWFRILVGVQLAAVVALAIVIFRLVTGAAEGAGQVISWATPHLSLPATEAPGTPSAGSRGPRTSLPPPTLPSMDGAFLHRLDVDTGATANGELHLVQALEGLIRDRVVEALDTAIPPRG